MAAKKQVYEQPREYIACAFAGCPHSATIKVWTKTGWANVCVDHSVSIVKKQADEKCKAMGLDTSQKQREWVLRNLKIGPLRHRIERAVEQEKVTEPEHEPIPF